MSGKFKFFRSVTDRIVKNISRDVLEGLKSDVKKASEITAKGAVEAARIQGRAVKWGAFIQGAGTAGWYKCSLLFA